MFTYRQLLAIITVIIVMTCCASIVWADDIVDMNAIKIIESSGDPKAYNAISKARGLYQITPICLQEWNINHLREQYNFEDLFNAGINSKIADWYLNYKIPKYLKFYKIEDTTENRIIAYNWGVNNLRKYKMGRTKILPKETINYISKYKNFMDFTKK
uniref:Putative transglycosylase n=2 Tax=viral metagenome TaxID=1070528 RepID=A0A6M3KZV7_9ZZZZ